MPINPQSPLVSPQSRAPKLPKGLQSAGFRLEADVRSALRGAYGPLVRFVDYGQGATAGIPDTFLPLERLSNPLGPAVLGLLELKVGEYKGGALRYTVRDAQRRAIPSLLTDRVPVAFLVGLAGTNVCALLKPSASALRGSVAEGWEVRGEGFAVDFALGPQEVRDAVERFFLPFPRGFL